MSEKSKIERVKRDESSDGDVSAVLTINSVSGLPNTDALNDNSLFEVSVSDSKDIDGNPLYTSKNVSWGVILKKVQAVSTGLFDSNYVTAREGTLKPTFDESVITGWTPTDFTVAKYLELPAEFDEFTSAPYVWGDVWALAYHAKTVDGELSSLEESIEDVKGSKIAFSTASLFQTEFRVFQSGVSETRQADGDAQPKSLSAAYEDGGSGLHTGFVLSFYEKSKVSTTWKVTNTGMLVLYGWLDTTNIGERNYLPDAWCALEGKINNNWEILDLCSVIPNKQITYASFTVPVVKDIEVRIRIGFVPGSGSGRNSFEDIPESLANHIPNSFVGGVYVTENVPSDSSSSLAGAPIKRSPPAITQNITQVVERVDLSDYATKEEVRGSVPRNFYGREHLYVRAQVDKALSYRVENSAILPEVAFESKAGETFGDDDRPINRLAVWNVLRATEEPIGTVIQNMVAPKERKGRKIKELPNHPEWVLCDGSLVDSSDFPELASAIGATGSFPLPSFAQEDSMTGLFHYVKVASSCEKCRIGGWSKDILKAQGVKLDSPKSSTAERDKMLRGVFDPRTGKYCASVAQTLK